MTSPDELSLEAEQVLLGACMYEKANATDASAIVSSKDFFDSRHGTIFETILQINSEGGMADPTLVLDRLTREKKINLVGGSTYLVTLYQKACRSASVPFHARLIAKAATYRRVRIAGQRIHQAASENQMDEADLLAWAAEQITAARDQRQGVEQMTLEFKAFLGYHPGERDMLIPGLMGVGDRLILTGHGGLGKSTYCQQIAVCAAGGLPPVDWATGEFYDPLKVSIFDCENPAYRVKNRLIPMVNEVAQRAADPSENLNVMKDCGTRLNVLDPHMRLSLLRSIEHDRPDLVYIGPLYKLHQENADKEETGRKLSDFLDCIREMGACIITEAHLNKEAGRGGSLEPSGTNLWTWWPEYGHGLRMSTDYEAKLMRRCDVERWRGDREENQWPMQIEKSGNPGLPWYRAS